MSTGGKSIQFGFQVTAMILLQSMAIHTANPKYRLRADAHRYNSQILPGLRGMSFLKSIIPVPFHGFPARREGKPDAVLLQSHCLLSKRRNCDSSSSSAVTMPKSSKESAFSIFAIPSCSFLVSPM